MLDLIGSSLTVFVFLALLVIFVLFKTALVVPNQQAVVVERLGKFHAVLFAGFHILIPFIDAVAYRRSLKEDVLDVPKQTCITKDNVSVDIGRRALPSGGEPREIRLRHQRLHVRFRAACPDGFAFRHRQAGIGQDF